MSRQGAAGEAPGGGDRLQEGRNNVALAQAAMWHAAGGDNMPRRPGNPP